MEKLNIGLVNYLISNKLKNSYFNKNLIGESKIGLDKLLDKISNSEILQLEFKIFNNLENKEISDDLMASRYIDNNIRLLEVYDKEEVLAEHNKLNFIVDDEMESIPESKLKLYESIHNLIFESLKNHNEVNVDSLHESFSYVLSHIKKPKTTKTIQEHTEINDEVVELAINKFNEKYKNLNEDEKFLIKTLTTSTLEEKKEMLETYKTEILEILNKHENENIKESIEKAKNKINKMVFNENDVESNIISLFEFKKEI